MSIAYKNVNRTDRLGYPGFFRIVLERGTFAFGDHDLKIGTERTFAAFASVNWVYALFVPVVAPGDSAVVLDVQSDQSGADNTVADLVNLIEGATYLTRIRSIEKIAPYRPFGDEGQEAADEREAVIQRTEDAQHKESALTKLGNGVQRAVIIAAIVAVLLAWRELRSLFRAGG